MPTNSKSKTARVEKPKLHKKTPKKREERTFRNFKLTRRRDYRQPLHLSGVITFTKKVAKILWKNKKIFLLLTLIYAILTALLVGLGSQDTYDALKEALSGTTSGLAQSATLFLSAASGGLSTDLSEVQQLYTVLLTLMAWLASIWLLRNILAGHRVKLRDGLYNSGAPILSTFLVFLLVLVQLLPAALAVIGFSAATATGFLSGGIETMLFWIAVILLVTLSVYWLISTFFALVIVTLPGMYPMKAIKTAGKLVSGRRLAILFRLLWMLLLAALVWAIIGIPMVLFDGWIKSVWDVISWLPIIPFVILILGSLTTIWTSSYIYLLYREVVDHDSKTS